MALFLAILVHISMGYIVFSYTNFSPFYIGSSSGRPVEMNVSWILASEQESASTTQSTPVNDGESELATALLKKTLPSEVDSLSLDPPANSEALASTDEAVKTIIMVEESDHKRVVPSNANTSHEDTPITISSIADISPKNALAKNIPPKTIKAKSPKDSRPTGKTPSSAVAQKNRAKGSLVNRGNGRQEISSEASFITAGQQSQIEASIYHYAEGCYPKASRRRGEEGVASLSLVIGSNGEVSRVKIIKSTGFSRLDDCAKAAVEKAAKSQRFTSARDKGKKVSGEIRLGSIRFRLES